MQSTGHRRNPNSEVMQVTSVLVELLEARGIEKYSISRKPYAIEVSLPNAPQSLVDSVVAELAQEPSAGEHAEERRNSIDFVYKDPRDDHALVIELKTQSDDAFDRDKLIATLKTLEPDLRRKGIHSLTLFGSAAKGTASPNDVDLVVRFDPSRFTTIFQLTSIQREIEDRLGRRVDLLSEGGLGPGFKRRVEETGIRIFGS